MRTTTPRIVAARVIVAAVLVIGGLLAAVPPARTTLGGQPDAAAGQGGHRPARIRPVELTSADERVAYVGTGHRGIGMITGTGSQATAAPLFTDTPGHFDDEVSARGDTITWVSRRDAPTPEVYLRTGNGPVTRVTQNSSTEGHPVLSPDGTRIAFHSDAGRTDGGHDIFIVGTAGGTPRRLTDGTGDNTWPTWSPDGTSIAFQGRRGSTTPQVYRMPAAGGPLTVFGGFADGAGEPDWSPVAADDRLVITANPDDPARRAIGVLTLAGGGLILGNRDGHRGTWSPDGNSIALLSTTPSGGENADGGVRDGLDRVFVGVLAPDLCSCRLTLRLSEDRQVGTPTWYTPAGGPQAGQPQLLVGRDSAPDRCTATLQDVRRDGSDPRDLGLSVLQEDRGADANPDLLYRPANGDPWFGRPAYSPDGRRIAVTRFDTVDGRRTARTWVANADGSSPRLIPLADRRPGGVDKAPAWSPDGTRIALSVQDPGGPFRTVIVAVDTGRRLLTVPGSDADPNLSDLEPAWSADGTTLAFTRGDPDAPTPASHVWLASAADGLDQRDLTAAVCGECTGAGQPVVDYSAAFSPDGTRIAFSRRDDGVLVTGLDGGDCRVVLPRPAAGGPVPGCGPPGTGLPIVAGAGGPHTPRDVVWSADGRNLAYSARRGRDRASAEYINTLDLDTGALTGLTFDLPGRQKYPTLQRSVDVSTGLVTAPPATTVGNGTSLTVEVRNAGPDPAFLTRLEVTVPDGLQLTGLVPQAGRCAVERARCDLGRLDPGRAVRVRIDLTGVSVGTFELPWTVDGGTADANPPDNRAQTTVRVGPPPPATPASPRITVAVTPTPAYVGGTATVTYTLRNAGGTASAGTTVRPTLPAGVPVATLPAQCSSATECRIADLPPGGSATLTIVLAPTAAVRTTVGGTLAMTGVASATATAPLVVLQPRIVAVPPVGPPGFVTSIRGTDFPPGTPVQLSWSVGVTVAANPVVPGADGTFAAGLLVLAKDRLGPRKVNAAGSGFSAVQCDFMVTVPAQQPPGLVQRR